MLSVNKLSILMRDYSESFWPWANLIVMKRKSSLQLEFEKKALKVLYKLYYSLKKKSFTVKIKRYENNTSSLKVLSHRYERHHKIRKCYKKTKTTQSQESIFSSFNNTFISMLCFVYKEFKTSVDED